MRALCYQTQHPFETVDYAVRVRTSVSYKPSWHEKLTVKVYLDFCALGNVDNELDVGVVVVVAAARDRNVPVRHLDVLGVDLIQEHEWMAMCVCVCVCCVCTQASSEQTTILMYSALI